MLRPPSDLTWIHNQRVCHRWRETPNVLVVKQLTIWAAGGRYDGILGVQAGVEALRTLHDAGIQTNYPVAVVNWTKLVTLWASEFGSLNSFLSEEGARFPKSMVGSAVWAGDIPLEDAWALKEVGNGQATMRTELERIGFLGEIECSYEAMPLAAHFELHIGK